MMINLFSALEILGSFYLAGLAIFLEMAARAQPEDDD